MSKLLTNSDYSQKQFKDIKVWKQSVNIDLWIEFELLPEQKKIALVIENKMYSDIRPGKLEKYQTKAKEYYDDKDKREIVYVLLRPDYEIYLKYNEKQRCLDLGYRYLNLEELKDTIDEKCTGNDLFDEFWFNWFQPKI